MSGNQLTAYFEYSPANVISILGSDFSKYRNVIIGDDILGRNCYYLRHPYKSDYYSTFKNTKMFSRELFPSCNEIGNIEIEKVIVKSFWNEYENLDKKKDVHEFIFDKATNQIVCEKELIGSMLYNDFSGFYSCISSKLQIEVAYKIKQDIQHIFKTKYEDQIFHKFRYLQNFKKNFNKSICEYTTEFKKFNDQFDNEYSAKVKKWASINVGQKNKNDCVEEFKINTLRNNIIDREFQSLFNVFLLENNFYGISIIWDFKEGIYKNKIINNTVILNKYLNKNIPHTNFLIKGNDIEIMKIAEGFNNVIKSIDEIPKEIFILRDNDLNQVSRTFDMSSGVKEMVKKLAEIRALEEKEARIQAISNDIDNIRKFVYDIIRNERKYKSINNKIIIEDKTYETDNLFRLSEIFVLDRLRKAKIKIHSHRISLLELNLKKEMARINLDEYKSKNDKQYYTRLFSSYQKKINVIEDEIKRIERVVTALDDFAKSIEDRR
ncbi:hypothetical protein BB560_004346 [Smittium megazygosporum]|uniref:Uncharacterized protein n=1 Tax=Smittium megazygosporum TaxID=133381 RepID=A0A2T9Z9M2_9FUNG|nr:hypothetical protein BB560_004346 [Smittium megazygosporum]